jgi:two-component system, LytTR family, response regulator LytT
MKILLIDSSSSSALALEQDCRAILNGQLERLSVADSVATAINRLRQTAFDVVVLDPSESGCHALELLASRTTHSFHTICVSAHTDLAVRAFEYGVLDFVPKPVTRERLAKALRRVPARLEEPGEESSQFLAVRRLGRIDLVPIDDLVYVEGADKYSELVLANGRRNFHDMGLGQLEAMLPRSFVRIHKSFIVRFNLVSRLLVLRGSRYFAELKHGQRLPVGRTRYEHIKARLICRADRSDSPAQLHA